MKIVGNSIRRNSKMNEGWGNTVDYDFDTSTLTGEEMLVLDELFTDMLVWGAEDDAEGDRVLNEIDDLFAKYYNRYLSNHKGYQSPNSGVYEDDKAWVFAEKNLINHHLYSLTDDTIKYYLEGKKLSDEQQSVLDKCMTVKQQKREPSYSVCDRYDFGPWTKYESVNSVAIRNALSGKKSSDRVKELKLLLKNAESGDTISDKNILGKGINYTKTDNGKWKDNVSGKEVSESDVIKNLASYHFDKNKFTLSKKNKYRYSSISDKEVNESLNESNDEDMGYKLGKWLGARLMTKWTAMLNVEGAEESPDYDEYDQQFDGNFVECLKKLEEYQNLIDQDGIEAYLALENWQSGEYFQGDYDRIIEDLIDRGYLYENDLEEYDDMDESLLNESKPSYNCCGIRISLPELRNRTEQNCKILRDNDDAIDYGSYGTFTTAGLCNDFWGYFDTNSEFEKLVKKYVGHYGPVLSSNREEAAFIFAVDELYPEIWDAIDSYTVNESLEESFNVSDETIEDAIEYYRENAFGFDGLKDYVETDFSHLPKETRNEIYNKMKKKLDESLNEDCNSYQYKGKTIINAGDYWFVKGYEEKFPTSDEAEEFVDDMKKDEGLEDKFRGPKPLRSFDDVLKAKENNEKLYYYEDGVGNDDNPIPVVVAGRPNKFQIPLARLGVDEPYTFTIMDFRNLSRDKAGNLDKLANESMKINIRESLNKMDAESDNTYDLLNLYESKNLSRKQKKDIARMIYENYGLERIYNYLYEATEESEDELPVEDRVKELTNDFKNTNGSYVFEDGQDANKAVSILKSRGYEASQKRTQDGKYRVTANKK